MMQIGKKKISPIHKKKKKKKKEKRKRRLIVEKILWKKKKKKEEGIVKGDKQTFLICKSCFVC